MSLLVGLCGPARAGKDSFAQALIDDGWERRAFADHLRSFLLALDPIVAAEGETDYEYGYGGELFPYATATTVRLSEIVNSLGWDVAKEAYEEIRELLQRCGTEAGRKVLGEDVWVNATLDDLPDSTRPPVVVTDVRFPNEVDGIRSRGGIVGKVIRPGLEANAEAWRQHSSETALDDVVPDFVVVNDGTLDELRAQARDRVRRLAASLAA